MFQDRQAFPLGINCYVPAMQYGAAVIGLGPTRFDLGVPATAGAIATLISAQGAVGPVRFWLRRSSLTLGMEGRSQSLHLVSLAMRTCSI